MGGAFWDNWSGSGLGPAQIGLPPFLQQFDPNVDLSGLWNWLTGSAVDTSGQTPAPGGAQSQAPGGAGTGTDALQQLLQSLQAGSAGAGAAAAPSGYTTPDGVFINDGSPEDRYYKLVDAVWTKIFGFHPDFAQARMFQQMGVQNTDQLNQIILQMPSHIKAPDGTPINIGTYEDMLTTGNKLGQQYFGRPIPDSLITDWVAQGLTEPSAIENWFWTHPAKDIPKDTYGAIWDAANQWTQQYQGKPI